MSKVVQYSNWGYWDQLDGVILRKGEHVRVTYPDGSTQAGVVRTVEERIPLNTCESVSEVTALIEFEFHGAPVILGLRGMECERIP